MDSNHRFRIRNNPFWLLPFGSAIRLPQQKPALSCRGTDGSNPSPSSAESANSSRQAFTYAGTYQRLQGRRVAADTAIWYRKVRGNVGDMAGGIDRLTVGPRSISSCWASPAPFAAAVH